MGGTLFRDEVPGFDSDKWPGILSNPDERYWIRSSWPGFVRRDKGEKIAGD
jgi:hypothetical protein